MKRIESFIRPERLEAVKEALVALGHNGLTVMEVKGHGIQKGITQQWRGEEYVIDLLPKVSVIAVVHDHEVQDCVDAIVAAAQNRPDRRRKDLRVADRIGYSNPDGRNRAGGSVEARVFGVSRPDEM